MSSTRAVEVKWGGEIKKPVQCTLNGEVWGEEVETLSTDGLFKECPMKRTREMG